MAAVEGIALLLKRAAVAKAVSAVEQKSNHTLPVVVVSVFLVLLMLFTAPMLVLTSVFGASGYGEDIVEVAIVEVESGEHRGGDKYWSWYGFTEHVEWCATFVSWCANQCGYLESGVIPKFSSCTAGIRWFQNEGLWQPSGYIPQPGDIIFFDWTQDGIYDHVGIVEYVEDGKVHTIEGNSGNCVRRRSYSVNAGYIVGYGTPQYPAPEAENIEEEAEMTFS